MGSSTSTPSSDQVPELRKAIGLSAAGTAATALAKLADEIDSVSGITQELAAGNQETAAAAQEVNTMSGEIEEAAKVDGY